MECALRIVGGGGSLPVSELLSRSVYQAKGLALLCRLASFQPLSYLSLVLKW